jgi:hypothetical protein
MPLDFVTRAVEGVTLTTILQDWWRTRFDLPPTHVIVVARDLDRAPGYDIGEDVVMRAANAHESA